MWAGKIPAQLLEVPCAARAPFPSAEVLVYPQNNRGANSPASSCWVCRAAQKQQMKPPHNFIFEGKTQTPDQVSVQTHQASNKSGVD